MIFPQVDKVLKHTSPVAIKHEGCSQIFMINNAAIATRGHLLAFAILPSFLKLEPYNPSPSPPTLLIVTLKVKEKPVVHATEALGSRAHTSSAALLEKSSLCGKNKSYQLDQVKLMMPRHHHPTPRLN